MSESENKTNSFSKVVNSVNSTTAEQVKLSSCDLSNQILAPSIMPASQAEKQEVVDCAIVSSGFEASEHLLAAIAPSQRLEVVSLIQVLRSSNSNLIERVTQLEQSLSECQEALQSSQKRSQVTESMLTHKTQELAVAQEQVKCLSQQIESSCQIAQRQQILIETLTAELQSSQERFAQLEWEHYLTQANYTEKSEQLTQSENTCRELRTRLTRQQHYTLQLKTALEKCLETPTSSYQSKVNSDSIPADAENGQIGRSIQLQGFFSKAESIPPWSAQPEFLSEEVLAGAESSILSDFQTPSYDHCAISDWSDEDLSTSVEVESILVVETNQPILLEPAAFIETFNQHPLDVFGDRSLSSEPDELLETTTDSLEIHSLNQDTTKPKEAEWQDLLNVLENVPEPATANSLELPSVVPPLANSASVQLGKQLNQSNLGDCHLLDPTSDSVSSDYTNQIQSSPPSQQKTGFVTPNSNWPSPLISPSHTSKQRKSLVAIELPIFTTERQREGGRKQKE